MVPKKSQFSSKGQNFALVKLFRGRSQIPNPVLKRLPMNKLVPISVFNNYSRCLSLCHLTLIPWRQHQQYWPPPGTSQLGQDCRAFSWLTCAGRRLCFLEFQHDGNSADPLDPCRRLRISESCWIEFYVTNIYYEYHRIYWGQISHCCRTRSSRSPGLPVPRAHIRRQISASELFWGKYQWPDRGCACHPSSHEHSGQDPGSWTSSTRWYGSCRQFQRFCPPYPSPV